MRVGAAAEGGTREGTDQDRSVASGALGARSSDFRTEDLFLRTLFPGLPQVRSSELAVAFRSSAACRRSEDGYRCTSMHPRPGGGGRDGVPRKRRSVLRAAASLRSNPFLPAHANSAKQASDAEEISPHLEYFETVKEEFTRVFVDSLPHEFLKSLPPVYQYVIGGLLYSIIIVIGSLFFWFSYTTARSTSFLSPDYTPGLCTVVQKAVDGVFLADTAGNWEHQPSFNYALALYKVQFSNFTTTSHGDKSYAIFQLLFSNLDSALSNTATYLFSEGNLAFNIVQLCTILFWAVTSSDDGSSNIQTFELTGDPTTVFNLPYLSAGLSTGEGLCGVNADAHFSVAEHRWTVSWPRAQFDSDAACTRALNPSALAQVSNSPIVSIRIDSRSFMALTGVNVPFDARLQRASNYGGFQLRPVGDGFSTMLGSPPTPFEVGKFTDYRWPGMDPLFCIKGVVKGQEAGGAQLRCVLPLGGDYFGFPFYDHFGANRAMNLNWWESRGIGNKDEFYSPMYCDCNSNFAKGKTSSNSWAEFGFNNCENFDWLHGLIILRLSENRGQGILNFLFEQQNVLNNGTEGTINRRAFNAAWYTVPQLRENQTLDSSTANLFYEQAPRTAVQRRQDFSFCGAANCTVLMMRSTGRNNIVDNYKTLNQYYYQVNAMSCSGEGLITKNFSRLASTPPASLQENYFICKAGAWDAFVSAVGTMFGNTALTVPIVVLVSIHLLFLTQWLFCIFIPRTYTAEEKAEIINGIALRLLLLRDSRHEADEEHLVIIAGLLKELQNTHEETEVFFLREHEKERLARIGAAMTTRAEVAAGDGGGGDSSSINSPVHETQSEGMGGRHNWARSSIVPFSNTEAVSDHIPSARL